MRIGRILVLALLLVAGGAVVHARQGATRPVSIAPAGPYAVGRAQHEWADRSRTDRLAPIGGTPRVISAWLWYPAVPAGGRAAAYAPGPWSALHRYGWAQTSFDRIATGTREDVALAPGRFPVVVLLPDLGMAAPQYQSLAASIAARGHVVVGVTPTYSASITVLGDRAVRASAAGRPSSLGGPRGADLVAVWAADARFAAEQAAVRLGSHVDAGRVVYAGHSFGAAAALTACSADKRCRGAVSLDGRSFPRSTSDRPLLMLGGRFDDAAHRLYAGARGPRWAYTISDAAFTDHAAYRLAAPLRWWLPAGRRSSLRAATDYVGAFLDVTTRGAAWTAPGSSGVRAADMLVR